MFKLGDKVKVVAIVGDDNMLPPFHVINKAGMIIKVTKGYLPFMVRMNDGTEVQLSSSELEVL